MKHRNLTELLSLATSELLAAAAHVDACQWGIVRRRLERAHACCNSIMEDLDGLEPLSPDGLAHPTAGNPSDGLALSWDSVRSASDLGEPRSDSAR
jgi:hypothetical protein